MVTINLTVNAKELPGVLELLEKYKLLSGIKTLVSPDQPVTPVNVAPQSTVTHVPVNVTPPPVVPPAPISTIPVNPMPVTPVPVTAPAEITLDQLSMAGAALLDASRKPELVALLGQFGVQALTQLPKEQYGAFATALRGLGARI